MNRDPETPVERVTPQTAAPSAEFIHAISQFLDTDPQDLLVELGYYQRAGHTDLVEIAAPHE